MGRCPQNKTYPDAKHTAAPSLMSSFLSLLTPSCFVAICGGSRHQMFKEHFRHKAKLCDLSSC